METKNYTQVLIDGKIYTLGGSEDEAYLQRTASYVNEKNMQLRGIPGFSKQSADYQQVMIQLNIADDYFKALDHSEQMEEERNRMEKESYSLKHELVSTQMKLEAVLKDLEERQVQLEETASHLAKLERENRNLTRQNERLSQERAEAVTEAEQMKALMLHQENELRAVGEAAASEEEPVVEENPVLEEEPEVGKETGEEPVSDEELARRALQAARKAGFHRGRR